MAPASTASLFATSSSLFSTDMSLPEARRTLGSPVESTSVDPWNSRSCKSALIAANPLKEDQLQKPPAWLFGPGLAACLHWPARRYVELKRIRVSSVALRWILAVSLTASPLLAEY